MSSLTPNKNYILPTVGGNVDTWGPLLNGDFSGVDLNLGGVLSLSVAGNSNITLSAAQSPNMAYNFTGALTGNIEVIWPPGGGFYLINNSTTGAFALTLITSAISPTGIVAPQDGNAYLYYTDGTTFFMVSAEPFTSGTVIGAFIQSTAPLGWTQVNTYNDAVLRFVDNTGVGGATGGSWTISGVTIGGTAITQDNLPNCSFPTSNPPHNHGTSESPHIHNIGLNSAGSGGTAVQITGGTGTGFNTPTEGAVTGLSIVPATTTVSVTSGGSSSPHTHGFSNDATWRPSFVNSLVASKK